METLKQIQKLRADVRMVMEIVTEMRTRDRPSDGTGPE